MHDWFYEGTILQAHILFLQKKYSAAAGVYQRIIHKNESPFKEEAEFNLLLCYLANFDSSSAKADKLIDQILTNKAHPFLQPTIKIKKQLVAE